MIREFDVTPLKQGSECKYAGSCQFYKYGIWCSVCNQYEEFEDYYEDDV